jgi:hypothetical protein
MMATRWRSLLLATVVCALGGARGHAIATIERARPDSTGERVRRSALLVFSGGVAGGLAKTCIAPLERLKLLRQLGVSTNGMSLGGTLVQIVRDEGVRGLWRGNVANVARAFPQKGMLLMCSDVFRELVTPLCAAFPWLPNPATLGGALAGVTSALVSYPLDVVFTQQAGRLCVADACATSATVLGTMRTIVSVGGLGALYAGAAFTLLSSFPYEGIKFGTFDWLKRRLEFEGAVGRHRALLELIAGAGAGATAHAATYPFDTVRRNLQMRGSAPRLASGKRAGVLGSAWGCARSLHAQGGMGSLYKGLPVTIMRTLPNSSLQFFFYEAIKRALGLDAGGRERAQERAVRKAQDAEVRAPQLGSAGALALNVEQ